MFGMQVWDGSLTDNERAYGANLWPKFSADPKTGITPTWASLLALFYPSVTGIMAGTNRSGKLAKPSQSIPKGTISAIAVTSLIYFVQVWLVGNVVSRKALMENKLVLLEEQLSGIARGLEIDQAKFIEIEAKIVLLKELLNS